MDDQKSFKLLLKNAKQVVLVAKNREKFKTHEKMNEIEIMNNISIIVDQKGLIFDFGSVEDIENKYSEFSFDSIIDCTDKSIIPGLVDGHTHPVWAGDRVHEFKMKLEGKTYMEIHQSGGGIGFTVNATQKATEEELLKLTIDRFKNMISLGTTLIEAKSGYGLDLETEIKQMKVLEKAKGFIKAKIVVNYCGAHSIPKGSSLQSATQDIILNQIPQIKILKDNGEINPELIDVFCEPGVYERNETRAILEAGKSIGLLANFHGDEINFVDSGTLAGEIKAIAVSHLENLDDSGIKSMADNDVIGVLLPTTHYLLKLKDPPTRKMIDNGVPVALGSDFNPNAYCFSMPFVMNLACINYKMKPNEALVAATLNSAASMNRSDFHGSIEIGKYGNFVVIDHPNWEYIIYQFGSSAIKHVIIEGEVIH